MRIAAFILLGLIIVFLGTQIWNYKVQENKLQASLTELNTELNQAKADQAKFQEELQYYQNPANLEKELRARFNYKNPGEKLMIIVDRSSSSTPSSSAQ